MNKQNEKEKKIQAFRWNLDLMIKNDTLILILNSMSIPYGSSGYLWNKLFSETFGLPGLFSWKLQSEHDGSDVKVDLNVEHQHEDDIVPNMTRSPRVKYITYYEDSESILGRRTAVWELDKGAWHYL